MPYPGRFTGRSAQEFLRDLPRAPPLKKAIGIAILNALSEFCWKRRPDYTRESGRDILDTIPLPEDGYDVVVGALVPIIRRLKARESCRDPGARPAHVEARRTALRHSSG